MLDINHVYFRYSIAECDALFVAFLVLKSQKNSRQTHLVNVVRYSGDWCLFESILFRYDHKMGHLFALSWMSCSGEYFPVCCMLGCKVFVN